LQWQNERIGNFKDENPNDLYLQGRKTYLNLLNLKGHKLEEKRAAHR